MATLTLRPKDIDEAVKRALEEPDLEEALTSICVWESERVVKQAHEYLNTGVSTVGDGKGWDTWFGHCIRLVTEEWARRYGAIPKKDGTVQRKAPFRA